MWKARPLAPLACDECGHQVYAKVSHRGLRFFQHAPGAPTCAVALESMEHHLLKLELANAARAAGAHAEMEVRGPDGAWRADVMATDPGGAWQWALEAQLAPITAADIQARNIRMLADEVWSIWFSDKPKPPWLGTVPSARLAHPEDGGGLVVAEGLVKWSGYQWQAVPASLTEFFGWAFTGRIINEAPHTISRARAHSEVAAAEQAARGLGIGSTDAQRREWRERTARRRDVTEIVARRGASLCSPSAASPQPWDGVSVIPGTPTESRSSMPMVRSSQFSTLPRDGFSVERSCYWPGRCCCSPPSRASSSLRKGSSASLWTGGRRITVKPPACAPRGGTGLEKRQFRLVGRHPRRGRCA